jgi:hypothetical protein
MGAGAVTVTTTDATSDCPHMSKKVYVPVAALRRDRVPLAGRFPSHSSPFASEAKHADPSLEAHVSVKLCPTATLVALLVRVGAARGRYSTSTRPDAVRLPVPQETT